MKQYPNETIPRDPTHPGRPKFYLLSLSFAVVLVCLPWSGVAAAHSARVALILNLTPVPSFQSQVYLSYPCAIPTRDNPDPNQSQLLSLGTK